MQDVFFKKKKKEGCQKKIRKETEEIKFSKTNWTRRENILHEMMLLFIESAEIKKVGKKMLSKTKSLKHQLRASNY